MGHRSRFVLDSLKHHNRHLTDADRLGKYGKMAQSAFRFYRGTNHIFWSDFGRDERLRQFGSDKTRIWIQGDLHTDNYGAYGNDDNDVVYSLNDFDDAIVADYQYDIWRMAISIILVAHQVSAYSLTRKDIERVMDAFVEGYLDTLGEHRGTPGEHQITFTGDALTGHLDDFLEKVDHRTTRTKFLTQWTVLDADQSDQKKSKKRKKGKRVFNTEGVPGKLAPVTAHERTAIAQQMEQYGATLTGKIDYDAHHFDIQDIAKRINAGTGSLGATRYYVLISTGSTNPDKGRILDVKHQTEPTPYQYMTEGDRQTYEQVFGNNHASRHAFAYRALTNKTDDYLGWMHLKQLPNHEPAYFSVRELSPYKRAFDVTRIPNLKIFEAVAANWGLILATAHARSDKNLDRTFINYSFEKQVDKITQGHHDEFRSLVKAIAFPYAEQVETDWQTFVKSDLTAKKIAPPKA